jgi:hypothetical protein
MSTFIFLEDGISLGFDFFDLPKKKQKKILSAAKKAIRLQRYRERQNHQSRIAAEEWGKTLDVLSYTKAVLPATPIYQPRSGNAPPLRVGFSLKAIRNGQIERTAYDMQKDCEISVEKASERAE